MRKINIAIDGPAGSGKGTLGALVAKKLNYLYIDSGVMYRLLSYLMIKNGVDFDDNEGIKSILVNEFDYEIRDEKIYFNDEDVSDKIRSKEVNEIVSFVAGKQFVRDFLIELQKNMASEKGIIMDGRDITSVVLPDAELKIYLDASVEERANRRYKQMLEKGKNVSYEEVKQSVISRDNNDANNNKTLVRLSDAVYIDTTDMTIEEEVEMVVKMAKERINND